MRKLLQLLLVGAFAYSATACSTDEYTVAEAKADLRKLGYTEQQANCVLDGLSKHYSDQYVKLNSDQVKEARDRGLAVSDAVNPKAVALYVRNVFAEPSKPKNDEIALAKRINARCKGS